ncbi:MAG: DNA polymerase III subunit beta [Clostridia bacterium]|nr:DNA polymerase III subunit beta [Clostridia bacterium]
MQFAMNVQDLLDGLNIVTRAISSRPAKQILEGVLIEADDTGVTLTCSDGNLTIQSFLTADIAEKGRVVLPGRLFTELVRKLPGGTMTIKIGDNFSAAIKCSSSKSSISGMNAVDYPEMPDMNAPTEIQIQQNRFKEMISRVVFSIATDETRQILTGCLLEVDPQEARMVALDGYRLALQKLYQPFNLPQDKQLLKAVIPGRVLNELSKILPDEETFATLSFDKSHMEARFGNTKMSAVLLAGEYIDYKKILPSTYKTEVKCSRTELADAIDRASLMAREGKNNLIRMSFHQDKVVITSNAEMGDVMEEVDCALIGEPLEIAFNAKYLTDVIRNINNDELCMKFNSNISPCIFTPVQGDSFLYLILPVRVFQ